METVLSSSEHLTWLNQCGALAVHWILESPTSAPLRTQMGSQVAYSDTRSNPIPSASDRVTLLQRIGFLFMYALSLS